MIAMAEARAEHDWSQTSAVLALIANVHRPRTKKAFVPHVVGRSAGECRVGSLGVVPSPELVKTELDAAG